LYAQDRRTRTRESGETPPIFLAAIGSPVTLAKPDPYAKLATAAAAAVERINAKKD